jgi:glycosyltransferase involved in cell wall biosynthesis
VVANSGGPAARPRRAVVDGWYRWYLPEHRSFGDVANRWPARLRPLIWRYGVVRAVTLVVGGRSHHAIVVIRRDAGWRSLLLLSALVHRSPKLVVLHFIHHPVRQRGFASLVDRLWAPVERWCLRRTVLRAHVLSAWEAGLYSERYRIDPGRFAFIPFAWRRTPAATPPGFRLAAERTGVIAAGRVSCDWATLFGAAQGQDWPLTVVCSAPDRPLVDALNTDGRAAVHTDLSDEEVRALLESSAVSVIATREAGISQGHVRLRSSVDAGAAVVASHTRSMDGYVIPGRTALLVAPGDPDALRDAVNRLLEDPSAREELARAAWERAEHWTWDHYLAALSELARAQAHPRVPQAAASASAAPAPPSSRREMTFDTPSEPIDTP